MSVQGLEPAYESGAASHLDRMRLTKRLCDLLDHLFDEHSIDHMEYGQSVMLEGNPSFTARLRKLDVKKSDVVCMTKFAPDYIVGRPEAGILFMMDAKASITPMFFPAAIRRLQYVSGIDSLSHHTIGEIEREAWDNYVKRFPPRKVAICLATPYHPRLVVAEWASELEALHRFVEDINVNAAGSGTPHVNLDLGAMRSLKEFIEQECSVTVRDDTYKLIEEDVKKWTLNKPARVNWLVFNNVVISMHQRCPWLKGRLPAGHPMIDRIRGRLQDAGVEYDLFASAKYQ